MKLIFSVLEDVREEWRRGEVEVERILIERRRELEEHRDILDDGRSAVEAAKGLLRETVEDYLSK